MHRDEWEDVIVTKLKFTVKCRCGMETIEPIPLETQNDCPPPNELREKHFNDRLLYIIRE